MDADVADLNIIKINNVVSTFYIGNPVYIEKIARSHPFLAELANTFSAGIMRFKHIKTTCLIFPEGKVVINGAKSELCGLRTAWSCCKILRGCGITNASVHGFKLQNVAMAVKLGPCIDMSAFHHDYSYTSSYPVEDFPAITLNTLKKDDSTTIRLFETGKVVMIGAKNVNEGVAAYNSAYTNIKKYIVYDSVEADHLRKKTKLLRVEKVLNSGKKKKS